MAASKFRGAVVEDLQLAPAFCLETSAPLERALQAAFEREFDYLPILNAERKPVGYLDVKTIINKVEKGEAKEDDSVGSHTTYFAFHRGPATSPTPSPPIRKYHIIHPLTPLEELEAFFYPTEATAGPNGGDTKHVLKQPQAFALITDQQRRWVIAVASRADLEQILRRDEISLKEAEEQTSRGRTS